MQKLVDWMTERFEHPLCPLFFLLGAVLVLLGMTKGIPFGSEASPVLVEQEFKWVAIGLGLASLATSVALALRPSRAPRTQQPVPPPADGNLLKRRDSLSSNQRRVLGLLESMHREGLEAGFSYMHGRLETYGGAELYYRLEHLRLLGFVKKDASDSAETVVLGDDRQAPDEEDEDFQYALSDEYARQLPADYESTWRGRQGS